MRGEYLIFNLIVLAGPLAGKIFFSSMKFPPSKKAFTAILPVAFFFIVWDYFVTDFFWYFNNQYTLGITFGKLPFEEILFFFTVPYACLTLWVNIPFKLKFPVSFPPIFTKLGIILTLFLLFWAIVLGKWYTASVCIGAGILLFYRKSFFPTLKSIIMLVIVCALTGIFNYYLTARPIVLYNEMYISNIKIGTIPIEDFIYGLFLIFPILLLYEKQSKGLTLLSSASSTRQKPLFVNHQQHKGSH